VRELGPERILHHRRGALTVISGELAQFWQCRFKTFSINGLRDYIL